MDYLLLPVVCRENAKGYQKLNQLHRQSMLLTRAIDVAREYTTFYKCPLTLNTLFECAKKADPLECLSIDLNFFLFTGRKVVLRPEAFFSWYETTAEGKRYKRNLESLAPDLYGTLAHVDLKPIRSRSGATQTKENNNEK